MNCAIYARVSTEKQGDSVDHQVSLLREVARMRETAWSIRDEHIYEDEGISATKHSIWTRPAMQRLLADAERGAFGIVLFKGISRFARNTQEALDVLDRLKAKGLRVVSYEENYDSAQENSNFMFTMHAAIAEYEAEKIGIRVRLGNKEKAKTGRWVGGTPPDGYRVGEDGRLVVDPARAPVIQQIFELYTQREWGCPHIARHLNAQRICTQSQREWQRGAVLHILRNEVYLGHLIYNRHTDKNVRDYDSLIQGKKKEVRQANPQREWVIVRNAHEALVSADVFSTTRKLLEERTDRKRAPRSSHPLTGLLICAQCGVQMICQKRRVGDKTYRYYICRTYHRLGRSACPQPSLPAATVEYYVACKVEQHMRRQFQFGEWEQRVERTAPEAERLQRLLKESERRKGKLLFDSAELYREKKHMEEEQYRYVADRLTKDIAQLTADQTRLRQRLEQKDTSMTPEEWENSLIACMNLTVGDETRCSEGWRTFIRQIAVNGMQMKISYTFADTDGSF